MSKYFTWLVPLPGPWKEGLAQVKSHETMTFTEGRPLNTVDHICKRDMGFEHKSLTPSSTWVLPHRLSSGLLEVKMLFCSFPHTVCVLPTSTTKVFSLLQVLTTC